MSVTTFVCLPSVLRPLRSRGARCSRSPQRRSGPVRWKRLHVLAAYDALADCDVIHDHTVLGPLLTGGRCRRRRDPPWAVRRRGAPGVLPCGGEGPSGGDLARAGGDGRSVPITAVIHHGIDLERYQPGGGGDYLVFVGRMAPQKGVHRAVSVARRAGRRRCSRPRCENRRSGRHRADGAAAASR